jgi:hypothetical protein
MFRHIKYFIPKKNENVKEIAEKVLLFLEGLKSINNLEFSNWFQQGWSKKEALEKKILFEKDYLFQVIEKEWDKKFPELGASFILWTGKNDDLFNSMLIFGLGVSSKNVKITNIVTLKFPSIENAPSIDEETIKSIINLFKEIWGEQTFEIG